MLKAGLPIRCAALSAAGGYDTHDNQEDSFGDDLGDTVQSLVAFQRDLEETPGSPTACSPWSGRSSAAAPRRTASAPTMAPAAPRS